MPQPRPLLRETHFGNARLSHVGLELLTLSELRARVSARRLAEVERVEFYMILVVTSGRGEHVVDFRTLPLEPGAVVFVRPGEVQQWRLRPGLEGDLLLAKPSVIQPPLNDRQNPATGLLGLDDWPTSFSLSLRERRAWRSLATLLGRELDQPAVDDLSTTLAQELHLCLMLRLSRSARQNLPTTTIQGRACQRMQRELEGLLSTRPTVELLAHRLHTSPSTLNRACRAKVGRSAKEVVDRRIALEAQRLLVHSVATSAAIGEQLGFSEPTNFLKFFRRQVGMTPEAFRQQHRRAEPTHRRPAQ